MTSTILDRVQGRTTAVAYKNPCVVATTANIALSGLQTIDGVALSAGDRVLVKDQDNGPDNGIWAVSATAWSRATDFDGSDDVASGSKVWITTGSAGAREYSLTTEDEVVIGASNIQFALSSLVIGQNVQAHKDVLDQTTAAFTEARDAALTSLAVSVASLSTAVTELDNEGLELSDFADQAALDTASEVMLTAGKKIISPVYHPARGLKISEFRTLLGNSDDQHAQLSEAIGVLFSENRYNALDLEGRKISISQPVDVAAAASMVNNGGTDYYQSNRICNGNIVGIMLPDDEVFTKTVTKSTDELTGTCDNVTSLEVGMHIEESETWSSYPGSGVPIGAVLEEIDGLDITSSLEFFTGGSHNVKFMKLYYLLDFIGFGNGKDNRVWNLHIENVHFHNGNGIRLPPHNYRTRLSGLTFSGMRRIAIDSLYGDSNTDIQILDCQFDGGANLVEPNLRETIGIGLNGADTQISNCFSAYGKHFAILNGGGHQINSIHPYQDVSSGTERSNTTAALIFNNGAPRAMISNSYIDNCCIEFTDARMPTDRDWLGSVSIQNTRFLNASENAAFGFIRANPRTMGRAIKEMHVTGCQFLNKRDSNTDIHATALDSRTPTTPRTILTEEGSQNHFRDNSFVNVTPAHEPLIAAHSDGSALTTRDVPLDQFPFDMRPSAIDAVSLQSSGATPISHHVQAVTAADRDATIVSDSVQGDWRVTATSNS